LNPNKIAGKTIATQTGGAATSEPDSLGAQMKNTDAIQVDATHKVAHRRKIITRVSFGGSPGSGQPSGLARQS
jgi:hypothetical protein